MANEDYRDGFHAGYMAGLEHGYEVASKHVTALGDRLSRQMLVGAPISSIEKALTDALLEERDRAGGSITAEVGFAQGGVVGAGTPISVFVDADAARNIVLGAE